MHYRHTVHLQVVAAVITVAVAIAWSFRTSAVMLPDGRADAVLAHAKWLALPLVVAVFLVMLKRGRSAELIKGHGSATGSLGVSAALLGNTVEQTLLAVLSLASFVSAAPADLGAVVHAFIGLFLAGRGLFFVGYALNPMWRFYGFSINFYASLLLLGLAWWFWASIR